MRYLYTPDIFNNNEPIMGRSIDAIEEIRILETSPGGMDDISAKVIITPRVLLCPFERSGQGVFDPVAVFRFIADDQNMIDAPLPPSPTNAMQGTGRVSGFSEVL